MDNKKCLPNKSKVLVGKNGGAISKVTANRLFILKEKQNAFSPRKKLGISNAHVNVRRLSTTRSLANEKQLQKDNKQISPKFSWKFNENATSTPVRSNSYQPLNLSKLFDTTSNTPKKTKSELYVKTTKNQTNSSSKYLTVQSALLNQKSVDNLKSKKPKSHENLSLLKVKLNKTSSSTNVSNKTRNNNNPKILNKNISTNSSSNIGINRSKPIIPRIVEPQRLEIKRGQGPSGSKNSATANQQHPPLKSSSSVSSLDGLSSNATGIKSSKSSTKSHHHHRNHHHGSKDKLIDQQQQNLRNSKDKLNSNNRISGSREHLSTENSTKHNSNNHHISHSVGGIVAVDQIPAILPKTKKKNSPMPIIQHQQQQQQPSSIHANNNLIDQRDIINDQYHHQHYNHQNHNLQQQSQQQNYHLVAPGGGVEEFEINNDTTFTRDPTTDINFDGSKEASKQQQSIMQELQSHLEKLTREKMALEAKIVELSSYQTEVIQLRNEITKLQNIQEKNNTEIQKLLDENETLRNRLRDVVNSPLSDAEKHQLIQDSQRLHSSAPASIALPNSQEADGTPCITPDWDKNSSSSEISVACLQDKIIQMEETHYSTNEELQATLQELADLQSQLTELQTDNERLAEEKDVLFQSLCRQTEKLEDSRTQITTLQELLLRESNSQESGTTDREQKLLDLLKSAQEERENLLIKQEELNSELNELRQALETSTNENSRLRERISLLDSTVDAANAERKEIESQLIQAKEDSSEKHIEISRLTTLLENARSKIDEYEQDRAMGDKSDLGELLDAARKEKDILESQVASLQEQVSKSQCEIQKLKDQLAGITEECKVARNNAKCALSDLEYKYETLKEEKLKLTMEYQQLQDSTNELQVQCKCHLEDKSQLESLLSETQRHLGEAERLLAEKEERLQEEIKLRKQEAEEWEQFQCDLLMTVRVANDFKTEAQIAREQLVMDNKAQREKIRMLEQQIEKLNKQVSSSDAQQSLLTTVQQEMAARRQKAGSISRQDSRLSVKSLIESIENVNRQTKSAGPGSRCSSSSSLNSLTSDALNTQNGISRSSTGEWVENGTQQHQLHTPVVTALQAKSPLREQQQTAGTNINLNGSQKSLISGERKDPLNALVKNGGSKRNALLKWCQNKTVGYRNIDITNFSSSWNDGLAFCAILHSYLPDRVPYDTLGPNNKRRNFSIAFSAAESVGIPTTLNINEMCQQERPDWTQVMAYVTAIYKHFET